MINKIFKIVVLFGVELKKSRTNFISSTKIIKLANEIIKQKKSRMKKLIYATVFFACIAGLNAQQSTPLTYEYKMFSTIESVVAGGLGRSRVISTDKNSQMQEKDLENLFSLIGINFKNIQNNDQIITSKINEYAKDGWMLDQVVNGVYGPENGTGIFLTRYIFKKQVTP